MKRHFATLHCVANWVPPWKQKLRLEANEITMKWLKTADRKTNDIRKFMLLSDYTGSTRENRKSKLDERQALLHGSRVPRQYNFKCLIFNSPLFWEIAANNLHEKHYQYVFQFSYLTSTCLALIYECNSRRANFAQTCAISDWIRGFTLGGVGWGYVQPSAKHDLCRQTNKKYFRLTNLLIQKSTFA